MFWRIQHFHTYPDYFVVVPTSAEASTNSTFVPAGVKPTGQENAILYVYKLKLILDPTNARKYETNTLMKVNLLFNQWIF